jgi:hypothetical protein
MTRSSSPSSACPSAASLGCVALALLVAASLGGCGKKADEAAAKPATDEAATANAEAPGADKQAAAGEAAKGPVRPKAAVGADEKAADKAAKAEQPAPVEAPPAAAEAKRKLDPRRNAFGLQPTKAEVEAGDRVFVLTRGRDRSYTDPKAVYHLYAHDVASVDGAVVTLKELAGGTFKVAGNFVVKAGTADAKVLKRGAPVLAEWASSLKHAVVLNVDGDKVRVRYTDLPAQWGEDKTTATRSLREVTPRRDGLAPGNFAIANDGGMRQQVLLVSKNGDNWLVQRFAGRVAIVAEKDLTPLPVDPKLKRGAKVLAPWVGVFYEAKVTAVDGARVTVKLSDKGVYDKPIVTALGQVLPKD